MKSKPILLLLRIRRKTLKTELNNLSSLQIAGIIGDLPETEPDYSVQTFIA